jgi:Ras-related protein Rab-5C
MGKVCPGGEYRAKVVLVGQSSVGKSSLALKFARGSFNPNQQSTIGAAFLTRALPRGKRTVHLDLWDTAGQERYNSLAPMYYRGADAIVLVYDISSSESFRRAAQWSEEVKRNASGEAMKILVGNKSDLEESREVSAEEARGYARGEGMGYIETSAKNSQNVEELFQEIAATLEIGDPERSKYTVDFREIRSSFGCC